jgi:two-component system, sporulation sensor kinase E
VAHELRTPLAAIRTASYNIRKKSDNPMLESNLENIDKKIIDSDQIIKNLLTYSHIKVPRYEQVDVCALMNECVSLAKELYHGYKVTVRMPARHPKNCVIEADPTQLKEVFTNVLNNAYESFPQQKGTIWLSVVTAGNYIKISVKDNGHGVDRDNLKRITEPFFTTKAKGTGLVLSICQQIIEMHNGKVKIESRANKGTTVTVILPITRSPAQPA